jgi:subtilase family serine protease
VRRDPRPRLAKLVRPQLEELESRALPSAAGWVAAPQWEATPLGPLGSSGYSPGAIRSLYGFDELPYLNGYGQNIAIVVANDAPTVYNDLITFDRAFGLPGQGTDVGYYLTKLNQWGQPTLPPPDASWAGEADLDVEWAHAMAPYAHIYLLEANSSGLTDLLSAVWTASHLPGVGVVSMSWGGTEFFGETSYDYIFTTPPGHNGVSYVAAAGDAGAYAGASWPAISSNVLAVGGTSLWPNGGELAWGGGGGGLSRYEAQPGFQMYLQSSGARAAPDVAYDADPNTGVLVYNSYSATPGWFVYGGTSVGAPQWAALIALADQNRAYFGLGTLGNAQALIDNLPPWYFRDISVGSNGYNAAPGYDLATGRGTPWAGWVEYGLTATPYNNYSGTWSRALFGQGGYGSFGAFFLPSALAAPADAPSALAAPADAPSALPLGDVALAATPAAPRTVLDLAFAFPAWLPQAPQAVLGAATSTVASWGLPPPSAPDLGGVVLDYSGSMSCELDVWNNENYIEDGR